MQDYVCERQEAEEEAAARLRSGQHHRHIATQISTQVGFVSFCTFSSSCPRLLLIISVENLDLFESVIEKNFLSPQIRILLNFIKTL